MKFKEIKSGMAIHCKNYEEKKLLLEEAERLGYMWLTGHKPTKLSFPSNTLVFREDDIYWTGDSENHTEFSDLIIPEPELSAEDALLAYDQMCRENYCCSDCPIYGIVGEECTHEMDGHITEIIDAIKKWKSDHEKKEPEIEWFWKSYVVGGSDYKEADTEQEAMEWCEYYAKEHPEAKCTYKHVCRAKAVK